MNKEKIFKIARGTLKENYNLSHLIWFKVGGPAELFFKPKDIEDLKAVIKCCNEDDQVTIVGAGSNMIIRDGGIDGLVIKLGRGFSDIRKIEENILEVDAACLNFNLAKYAAQNSLKGLEFLVGIPGAIGGGIAMNAGSYGSEYRDIIHEIEAIDRFGNLTVYTCDEVGFGYRHNSLPQGLIFTKARVKVSKGDKEQIQKTMDEISAKREETQPIRERTGGSTFANPEGRKAWELIDQAGLRGYKIGGAMFSEKHCNFMINTGNASAKDMEKLGELARSKVKQLNNVELKWEIKRFGKTK